MGQDTNDREPSPAKPDLWTLPAILDVRAVRVRFKEPRIRYDGTQRVAHEQAVELIVKTSGPIPERAISPILMVGDAAVSDYEYAGPNNYRFYAFDISQLQEGARMRLEWPLPRQRIERNGPVFELLGDEQR